MGTIGGMNINYLPILVIQYNIVNLKYLAKKTILSWLVEFTLGKKTPKY